MLQRVVQLGCRLVYTVVHMTGDSLTMAAMENGANLYLLSWWKGKRSGRRGQAAHGKSG